MSEQDAIALIKQRITLLVKEELPDEEITDEMTALMRGYSLPDEIQKTVALIIPSSINYSRRDIEIEKYNMACKIVYDSFSVWPLALSCVLLVFSVFLGTIGLIIPGLLIFIVAFIIVIIYCVFGFFFTKTEMPRIEALPYTKIKALLEKPKLSIGTRIDHLINIICVVGILLFFGNPTSEDHRRKFIDEVKRVHPVRGALLSFLNSESGWLENMEYKDYYLYSITKRKSDRACIAVGIAGRVLLEVKEDW